MIPRVPSGQGGGKGLRPYVGKGANPGQNRSPCPALQTPPSASSWQNAALALSLSLWPSLLPSPFPSSFPPRLAARASFYLYVNLSLSLPLSALLTRKRCLNANQEGEGGDVCQPVGSQWGVSERLQLCLSLSFSFSPFHTHSQTSMCTICLCSAFYNNLVYLLQKSNYYKTPQSNDGVFKIISM